MSLRAVESGNEWPPGVQPPEGLPTTPIRAVVDVTDGTHAPRRGKRPHYGTKRRVTLAGYVDLWRPGHPMASASGYAPEHRLVAYEAGLLTDPTSHVHHRNHDKADNRLENLEVLSAEEHARHHAAEDGYIVNQYGTWQLRDAPRWPTKHPRPCLGCPDPVPVTRRRDALYCTNNCRMRTFRRQQKRQRRAA